MDERTLALLRENNNAIPDQGDLAGARLLCEPALAIREKVLGPENPDTAISLSSLGRVLRDLGETPKAEPLFHRAIAIGEKALGAEHPRTQRFRMSAPAPLEIFL